MLWAAPSQSFTTFSTAKDLLSFGANVAGSSAVIDTGAATVNLDSTGTLWHGADQPGAGLHGFAFCLGQSGFLHQPELYHPEDLHHYRPGRFHQGLYRHRRRWRAESGLRHPTLRPRSRDKRNQHHLVRALWDRFGDPGAGVHGFPRGLGRSGQRGWPEPNFAAVNPGTYTVTAQDGVTTKSYRVAIGLLPYNPVQITNGSFEIGKAMDQGSGAYAQVSLPGTGLARVVRQLRSVVYVSLGWNHSRGRDPAV